MSDQEIKPITPGYRIAAFITATLQRLAEFMAATCTIGPLLILISEGSFNWGLLWMIPYAVGLSSLATLWFDRAVIFGDSRQAALILTARECHDASLKALKISRKSFWSGTSDLIRIHQSFADHLSSFRDTYAEILEKSYK